MNTLVTNATKEIMSKYQASELGQDFAEGIIETLRDPLLVLDNELNVIAANTAFYQKFSTTLEETEQRKIYTLNDGAWDFPKLRTLLENTLVENSSFRDFELDAVFPSIGRKIFLLNGRRIYENGERTQRILLVFEDISARRKQEQALQFQADALNRVNDAVIAINNDNQITYWNSRAELLLNIPKEANEGIELEDICTRINADSPGALFATSSDDEPWREYRISLNDSDEEYYLESSATNNFEKDGSIAGRLVVLRDVTARRKAEIALKVTNHDLELFTSIASHDLQEPLRMVSLYVGLLAKTSKGKLGPAADSYISYALEGTKRMHTLIKDLLKYAHVQPTGDKDNRLALSRVVADVVSDLKVSIEESHATIEMPDWPEVFGNETQMRQVFQNLIGNAIKYKSEKRSPLIAIKVEKEPRNWLFSVTDNGRGFDTANVDTIFKLFHRLPNTSESGTGLGLSITKKIIEAHGGRIWAKSVPGEGSTFSFTLPR